MFNCKILKSIRGKRILWKRIYIITSVFARQDLIDRQSIWQLNYDQFVQLICDINRSQCVYERLFSLFIDTFFDSKIQI